MAAAYRIVHISNGLCESFYQLETRNEGKTWIMVDVCKSEADARKRLEEMKARGMTKRTVVYETSEQ